MGGIGFNLWIPTKKVCTSKESMGSSPIGDPPTVKSVSECERENSRRLAMRARVWERERNPMYVDSHLPFMRRSLADVKSLLIEEVAIKRPEQWVSADPNKIGHPQVENSYQCYHLLG